MRPGPQFTLQAFSRRLQPLQPGTAACLVLSLISPAPLWAQDITTPAANAPDQAVPVLTTPAENQPEQNRQVEFEANALTYDDDAKTVTASGDVLMRSGDQSVRADNVTWDRTSGQIVATGSIRFVDDDGNQLYTDRLELTDELKAGAMSNLLLALREGGRLAATQARRDENGDVVMDYAVYSACAITTPEGCDKKPSWRVTAKRVRFDESEKRIRFEGAYFEIFGTRLIPLPGMSVRSDGGADSGFLMPDIGLTQSNGLEVRASHYWRLAPNRDLLVDSYIYTDAVPMISGTFRNLGDKGAYQITGYLTQGSRLQLNSTQPDPTGSEDIRGYFAANGRWQLDPNWSISASARYASDRTFLRRYDISRDDRIRSTFNIERIDEDSYLSIAGWATQLLLVQDDQGLVPLALPVIDYRRRLADPLLGGTIELQANTLAITRLEGQDTQRAFTQAQWNMRRYTPLGQEISLTGLVRGDVYHSSGNDASQTDLYRGVEGWQGRGVALAALDVKWPFVGSFMGGTQILTPRVQVVASPTIRNLEIPNEDSRAIDLEDSNLFSLNRFPGYDRVEDGSRITYGVDWQADLPGWRIKTTLGQSYRLTEQPALFPDGTGLSRRVSDFVGRTEIQFRDFIKFTHRYRLDKDNLAVRRNELDASIGSDSTYFEVGYLRLNRDVDLNFEDLQDREELRVAGRIAFARYWSVFGSAVVNLTDREEDPSFTADGFDPLRTRLGFAYSDDCLEFGLVWRRDYIELADSQRGNSFRVYFNLRNLGFR